MALVKVKPTSAGRRALIKVVNHDLHKGAPIASLVESQKRGSGRNNHGHITTRHKGGGHKQHYRIVDFRRNKDGVTAKVERLEYDPNRAFAPARSARCTSIAAQRSAKWATRSTVCVRSARPARSAGAAFDRRCAASR